MIKTIQLIRHEEFHHFYTYDKMYDDLETKKSFKKRTKFDQLNQSKEARRRNK